MAFVNPYTFIAFPKEVIRRKPLGHAPTYAEARQRYTGSLEVTWRIRTPLAIPQDGSWGLDGIGDHEEPATGPVRIPGASVKGAVRSVHEALFAGCARVIDPLFTPVYRELMSSKLGDGWTLSVVVSPDADVTQADPLVQVMPCGDVGWTRGDRVKAKALQAGRLPQTGDFINPAKPSVDNGRTLFADVQHFEAVERGACWLTSFKQGLAAGLSVILVTDTAARDSKNNAPYYWATARPNSALGRARLSPAGARRFRQRLRGADRADAEAGVFEPVMWPPASQDPAARRRTVDGVLRQGDVVWTRLDGNEVVDLKLSLGWRVPAVGARPTLESRIPRQARPCRHLTDGLCLSCVIFGSVDATPGKGEGRQDSYGGHVRFGDVTGHCSQGRRNVQLAPLGAPHPGAGMYYLAPVTTKQMDGKWMIRPDRPSSWDSAAGESAGSRDLRGRKFYWHSDPARQQQAKHLNQPRYRRLPNVHTNPELVPTVHLVEQASLQQRITFDGLDSTALATLLAALQPSLVLGEGGDYALHLGRGKPFGLGSVQAKVQLHMTTTADRYAVEPATLTDLPELATALSSGVRDRCGDLTSVYGDARTVLDLNGLGERAVDVSYPTVKPWSMFTTDAFHESFTFFQENAGEVRSRDRVLYREPWGPLPLANDQQGQGTPQ